jgi:N-acetylmuramoyl-L-alanine amidase-like protein
MPDGWNPLAKNAERDRSNYARKCKLTHIVIHCTGNAYTPSHNRFMTSGVSPHYLIKLDGTIVQYVKDELRAGHAAIHSFSQARYRDGTWRKWKRAGIVPAGHYNKEGETETTVISGSYSFTKIKSGADWKIYAAQEEVFAKRIGSGSDCDFCGVRHEPKLPYHFEHEARVNDYSIGIEIVHVSGDYLDVQYAALIRLLANLCETHGIPFDKYHIVGHEDTNPIERWGWDPGTVREATRSLFDWQRVFAGGDWALEESADPVVLPRPFQVLRFPFGSYDRSPLTAYFENEASFGGYFPLGLRGNLHTGIHVYPALEAPPAAGEAAAGEAAAGETAEGEGAGPAPPQPVFNMAPGWIVAARLPETGDLPLELTGADRGFVLVRHEFRRAPEEGAEPEEAHALYSLYMHLAPPNWEEVEGEDPYSQVLWLHTLLKTCHGAIVTVAAKDQVPGTMHWAATELPESLRGEIEVYDRDGATVKLLLEGEDDAVLAVKREQPADPHQALGALKSGAVATFSAPYLHVCSGDVLGFVREHATFQEYPTGFLHWELLAPAGAGLKELFTLAAETFDLGPDFFPELVDESEGNFWKLEELSDALTPHLPQADQDALGEDALEQRATERGLLPLLHAREPLSFADHTIEDKATWTGREVEQESGEDEDADAAPLALEPARHYPACDLALTYPLVLEIENYQDLLSTQKHELKFRVTFLPEGLGEGQVAIEEDGSSWSLTIHVPAAATEIRLHPEADLHLDTQVVTPALSKDLHSAALKALLPHRWRNLRVKHRSPWSLKSLRAHVLKHFSRSILDQVVQAYAPLAFWDLGDGSEVKEDELGEEPRDPSWKEVPVLGTSEEEVSVFGPQALLPDKDGELDAIHPVTGAWLLNALCEVGAVQIVETWSAYTGSGESAKESNQPMHLGWVADCPLDAVPLGHSLTALVVTRGFRNGHAGTTDDDLVLKVRSEDGTTHRLGSYDCQEGILAKHFQVPLWGKWTLEIEGHDSEVGDLPRSFTVKAPVLGSAKTPFVRRGFVNWELEFSENQPSLIEGLILLKYWTVEPGEEPSGPGTEVAWAIPVVGPPEPTAPPTGKAVLDSEGIYMTGAESTESPIPDADSVFRLKHYKWTGRNNASFKMCVSLGRMVDKIRTSWGLSMKIDGLSADGLSIKVAPKESGSLGEFQTKVEALASELESQEKVGGWIQIRVAEPGPSRGGSTLRFSAGDALRRLLDEQEPPQGKLHKVSLGFFWPNGGARVGGDEESEELAPDYDLERFESEPAEDGEEAPAEAAPPNWIDYDAAAVRSRCGEGDLIEVWSEPILEVSKLEFFPEVSCEVAGWDLKIRAEFSSAAEPAEFAAAGPRLQWGDKTFGQAVAGTCALVGSLPLRDLYQAGGEEVSLQAKLTASPIIFAGQDRSIPALDFSIPAKPGFEDLQVEWVDEGTKAQITARANLVPTSRALELRIYKEGERTLLNKKVRFTAPWHNYQGFAAPTGEVTATILYSDLDLAFDVGEKIRFELLRPYDEGKLDPNIAGSLVEAASVEVTLPAAPQSSSEDAE